MGNSPAYKRCGALRLNGHGKLRNLEIVAILMAEMGVRIFRVLFSPDHRGSEAWALFHYTNTEALLQGRS